MWEIALVGRTSWDTNSVMDACLRASRTIDGLFLENDVAAYLIL
jgi:hypothetical protein